ncbi:hypothetical protein [Paucisalibacillus globulus]|uniref:hypothetical protein n=1 Tax=Paucisalibacillus globulus TaxID=351095 RepID=UPI00041467E8|nr:hypothetical protein [Paucisalibacillus globulus]
MDKEIKNLQSEFNQIPTTFTNKDKQAVRGKIEKLQNQEKRKVFQLYPKALTGAVVALAILLLVITINQSPNFFTSSNDSAGSDAKTAHEIGVQENATFDMENSDSTKNDLATEESSGLNIFNPNTVQDEMILPVLDVQQNGDEKIITFKGDLLTGLLTDEQSLMFHPNEETWNRIPIAEADIDKEIPIYFSDEELARSTLNIEQGMVSDLTFQVDIIEYHYSPNGSSIYLTLGSDGSIPGEATNTYKETIELSEELLTVYEEYRNTLNDKVLQGLVPFEVFKLYHYADLQGDLEVTYALYFNKENHFVPDKETFMADANQSNRQADEIYNEMLEINTFDEIYLTENEVLIRFTTDHDIGFRLLKDKELNVWKVSWLPIQ